MGFFDKLGESVGKSINKSVNDMNEFSAKLAEKSENQLIQAYRHEGSSLKKARILSELKNRGCGPEILERLK